MTEQINMPELRFSEYEKKWLSNNVQIKILAGNAYKLNEYTGDGYLLIQGLHIQPNKIRLEKVPKYVSLKGSNHLKIVKGDIVLGLNRPITNNQLKACRFELDKESVLYQRAGKLAFDLSKIDTEFLYQYLRTSRFMKQLELELIGSDQPYIRSNLFQATKNIFPSLPEQQKIASLLSKVDKKIALLTEKKDKLTEYKKGVMQQLFNGKFEQSTLSEKTTFISPTLRFKAGDGSDFPDWEKKKLSDFVLNHKGGAPLKPSDFVKLPEYEVIPKKAIQSGGKLVLDKSNPTYCSKSFFTQYQKNIINDEYLVTTLRDLVPSGPTIGFIVRNDCKAELMLAQGVYGFRVNDLLDEDFLIHQSNTSHYRKLMQQLIVGSTQVHIRNDDFFGMSMVLPTLPEQVKIANFLSATNQKINLVNSELEKTKEWKKGLLQQMFV